MKQEQAERKSEQEALFRGIGVSSGMVVGRVFLKASYDDRVVERSITAEEVPSEIARFEAALIATRRQIQDWQKKSDPAVAEMFNAHLLIMDDRPFVDKVISGIEQQQKNVEVVLSAVVRDFVQALSKMDDRYLRERVADVQDLSRRILHHLLGRQSDLLGIKKKDTIIVANDILPSEIVSINKDFVLGVALDLGSPTSHAAILVGKLGIPCVVGLNNLSAAVNSGNDIFIDGAKGLVIVNPSPERRRQVKKASEARVQVISRLAHLKDLPAETRDGYRVVLSANIESPQDVDNVLACGAEGVGLFRTEFFYMSQKELPSEETQFEAYHSTAKRLDPAPVIIRTLDLGGDKFLENLDVSWNESNPFMGWRAIRFCLAQPDLFKVQLRAILRASICGNVRIMYPMISNVDEIARANAVLDQAKQELLEKGYPFNPHLEVGAMIEVPSAAVIADLIAPHVSFFSLGTNDLIQYTLAIDRGNERVAYLYEPMHLAILRLIKNTVDSSHRAGIWTGICGSMAGDPLMIPLLIGLGINEISVSPAVLPLIKKAIRETSYSEACEKAEAALASWSGEDIHDSTSQPGRKIVPEILELG